MERLTSRDKEIHTLINNAEYWLQAYFKLKDYEDLEEQGLLLKLPIPIGTTVYKFEPLVSGKKEYIKTRVSRYDVFDDSVWFCFLNGLGRNIEAFGKYVFLTQAEAEEALKKFNESEENP